MPLEVITPDEAPPRDSGLRHNILSPLETLSQSVSAIAPTTSPALTVPLVFALAGNGTWLAYSLAGGATLLMALSIARFARTSASPGSLYKYATDSLPAIIFRSGLKIDVPQAQLHAVTPSGVRLGVILALFSFAGFESATTLGHEARNPLRTIPRAVIQSAVLAGLFFLTCCYTEVLGFRQLHLDLGASQAPFRALATLAHIPIFGPLIDVGAFVSMFACTLACITAAARVLLKMAHDGLAPAPLGRAHSRNETPHLAVLSVGLVVLLISIALTARGVSGAYIYGYMGSLSVYGFITVYFLVAAALPIYLRRRAQLTPAALTLAIAAALAMLLAMAGTLYPIPAPPYNVLPYIYLAYLALGLTISLLIPKTASNQRSNPPSR
jgi:amino acid transporter